MSDITIFGGGLAGGLIARALVARRPEIAVTVIEAGERLGGNHVWSFFDTDIAADDRWLVDDLVTYRWPAYDIAFPKLRRTIPQGYNSIESEQFDRVLRGELGARIVHGDADNVIHNGAVIDARGPGDLAHIDGGWQKFVGISFQFATPHGIERPTIMDATVEQIDGYRFVYVLPFGERELFVEDTYYSDTRNLDSDVLRARLIEYVAARGWDAQPGNRFESGVLPVIMAGDFEAYWRSTGDGAKAGMRAGLCHPTTGYSLPDAVRLASAIAKSDDLSADGLARLTHDHARRAWGQRGFYRLLDRMLFRAGLPAERYRVLQRFYGLPEPLIGRFYAGQSTLGDIMRTLSGKPPVPFWPAVRELFR
ncbi:Putative lycopene beta cyclase [Sphingomonas antarctica]|uniref:lycopene beta-cyclase CrtY n=1 Tax=Sphingomonas antarctica TaxID=2040274 RepID=UPI0039EBAAD9